MPIYIVKVSSTNGDSKLIRVKALTAEHVKNGLNQKGFNVESVRDELEEGFSTEASKAHFSVRVRTPSNGDKQEKQNTLSDLSSKATVDSHNDDEADSSTLTEMKRHEEKVVLARLQGKRSMILLTNYNIRQEIIRGLNKVIKIIPLHNIDSFGIVNHQKPWLAVIAGIMITVGITGFIKTSETEFRTEGIQWSAMFLLGLFFFIAWVATRKIGGVIYSVSGKTEIFFETDAGATDDVMRFIDQAQRTIQTSRVE